MKILIGEGYVTLDEQGCITDVNVCTCSEKSIFPSHTKAPFIQIGVNGEFLSPISMTCIKNILTFSFENQAPVQIAYEQKDSHATFEVVNISKECECIAIGPIPNTISEMIGDVIGVVWNESYAFGIQGLNQKTLPGFPHYKENGYGKYGSEKVMSEISVGTCDYFRSAAYEAECGSVLQMFCENRRLARVKKINNVENVLVAPYDNADADIKGAKFALFASHGNKALETIGEIELCEGLPHPIIDGEWGKTSRTAMRSYFITEFGPSNIDKMLDYTVRGGFRELYHSEPFKSWGHFDLIPKWFPNGDSDLVDCSTKASTRGIGLGVHTLTSFTTTNDPFVSPVPHPSLVKVGTAVLNNDIDEVATEIIVKDASLFKNQTSLQLIQLDNELIQFSSVDLEANILKGCTRGAFSTAASAHTQGCKTHLLWDYPGYNSVFPDINLQDSHCDRIIELFNRCNLVQISFDGLEGCHYCGEEEYASNRFCMRCYEGWENEVINDASNLDHFLWHMNTRMNWGEPWGEKMRQGMIDYRLKNQKFYEKNLFPRMLGWFLIRLADRKFEATTLDDIEWALSKAAGLDAGFALYVMQETLDKLGISGEILDTIKCWEKLRIADAFPSELKAQLKLPSTEWHMEKSTEIENECLLYPADMSQQFTCDLSEMQPGQKGGSDWSYSNQFDSQEYQLKIKVIGDGFIENPSVTTRGGTLKFPCRVENNQYIFYKGNSQAVVTDKNYNVLSTCQTLGCGVLSKGQQPLSFACTHGGEEPPEVQVSVFTYGNPIKFMI